MTNVSHPYLKRCIPTLHALLTRLDLYTIPMTRRCTINGFQYRPTSDLKVSHSRQSSQLLSPPTIYLGVTVLGKPNLPFASTSSLTTRQSHHPTMSGQTSQQGDGLPNAADIKRTSSFVSTAHTRISTRSRGVCSRTMDPNHGGQAGQD